MAPFEGARAEAAAAKAESSEAAAAERAVLREGSLEARAAEAEQRLQRAPMDMTRRSRRCGGRNAT